MAQTNANQNIDLSNYFIDEQISAEHTEFFHKLLDMGCGYLNGKYRDNLVLKYADNEFLKNLVAEPLPMTGSSLQDLSDAIEKKVLPYSIAQFDKKFLAFPDTGNSVATLAADIIAPFINQNLIAIDRSAPVATFIEMQVIMWLRKIIGYSSPDLADVKNLNQVGGMWTSGGNLSNYTSVLVALHKRFPEIRKGGLVSLKKRPVIVLARGIDHFSFACAATALGLGSDGLLWAEANDAYQTDTTSLRHVLDNCPDDVEPFMVVSVAGNCRTTSIDNIEEIRQICDERNLWMHVDGCHGGSLLFSSKLKCEFLSGIEKADSVTLDPHKGLFLTYPASYVLFRDPTTLATLSRYPDKTKEDGLYDLGLITPFLGSRGFQSLKLWLLLKHLGVDGLAQALEARQDTNRQLTNALKDTGLFVFFNENKFYRQVFVFCPEPVLKMIGSANLTEEQKKSVRSLVSKYSNKFNTTLYESGEVVFDAYQMLDLSDKLGLGVKDKYSVLSMSIGHTHISQGVVDMMLDRITKLGNLYTEEMIKELSAIDAFEDSSDAKLQGPAGW